MVEEHMEDYPAGNSTPTANPDDNLPRYFMLTDVEVAEYSAAHQNRLLEAMEALAARYPNASAAELISFAKNELVSRELEKDMTNLTNPSGLLALTTGLEEEPDVAEPTATANDPWAEPGADDLILETSGERSDEQEDIYETYQTEEEPEATGWETPAEVEEVEEPAAEEEPAADELVETDLEDVEDAVHSEDTDGEDAAEDEVEEAETQQDPLSYIYETEEEAEPEAETLTVPQLDYSAILDDPEDKPWMPQTPVSRVDGHELAPDEILDEDSLSDPGIPFPTQSHPAVAVTNNDYETYAVEDEDAYNEPSYSPQQEKQEPSTDTGTYDPFADLDDGFSNPVEEPQKNYYRGLFHEAGQIEQADEQPHS